MLQEETEVVPPPEEITPTINPSLINRFRSNYHVEHVKNIISLAIPVVISYVAGIVLGTVDNIFLGHLGSTELAAGALGTSIAFALYFLVVGFATYLLPHSHFSALDTFFSQAFGAKNYPLIGVLLQRGFILITIGYIPVSIFLYFTEDFLLLAGQEPVFSKMTGNFVIVLMPGYLPYLWHGLLNQYLNAQHIMFPNVVVVTVENILNVLFNFFFIYGIPGWGFTGFGYYGSPLATTLSRICGFFGLLFWIWIRKLHAKTWFGIDIKKAMEWKGLVEFSKIGIPGVFMVNLEAWVYVLGTNIPCVFMGEKYVAANSIVLGMSTLNFMFPLGLSVAASVLVGNHLGEGDIKAAKTSGLLSVCMAGIGIFLIGLFLAITHPWLGYIFSNDKEVVDLAGKALLVLAFNTIPDGIQGVLSGITRGIGKQVLGASVNFISYYVIGLPLGIVFAFVFKWEIIGLYVGLIFGAITSCILFLLYLIFVLNWEREVEIVKLRVGLEESSEFVPQVDESKPDEGVTEVDVHVEEKTSEDKVDLLKEQLNIPIEGEIVDDVR
jgi:MATE family multidrug resistance protein